MTDSTTRAGTARTIEGRALVALDIDGTVLHEDGTITDAVIEAIHRVRDLGNEVMLATGRSVSMTLPIVERLGIAPDYLVCSNGAITLRRDEDGPTGYSRWHVETFDPSEVLTTISGNLEGASYAIEDAEGLYLYSGTFPDGSLGASSKLVGFDDLLGVGATRVVVISPEHEVEDFLQVVEKMGLHKVSYNIGWTAWLDIAPDGVNKGTALERVRAELDVEPDAVVVMGDGRNDIDMFEWAVTIGGVAVAMGQAPDEVKTAANTETAPDVEDGVAQALDRHFPAK